MRQQSEGSRQMHIRCSRYVAAVVVGVLVGGCQLSSASSASRPLPPALVGRGEGHVSQQLLVKFAPNTIACTADGIAELSVVTHVRLTHVRSMSGDTCVLTQWAARAADLVQGQVLLRRYPMIEWIEDDRVLQPL